MNLPRTAQGNVVWSPTPRLRLGRFHSCLGWALICLLGLLALVDLADLAVTCYRLVLSRSDRPDPFGSSDLMVLTLKLELVHIGIAVVIGIGWLVWQTMAALSSRVPRAALRHGPFWHFAGWFLPVAGLVLPLRNMADLRYAVETPLARREGNVPDPKRTTALLWGWWASWLLCIPSLVLSITNLPYQLFEVTPDASTGVEAAMDVAQIVNSALAAAVVGEVHFRLRLLNKLGIEVAQPFN